MVDDIYTIVKIIIGAGGAGFLIWLFAKFRKSNGSHSESPPITEAVPGDISVPPDPERDHVPSSKQNIDGMKSTLDKILNRGIIVGIGVLLTLRMMTPAPLTAQCPEKALTEDEINYIRGVQSGIHTYVTLNETEWAALLKNLRKDTTVETWIIEKGKTIAVEVTIPMKYPIFQVGTSYMSDGPSIKRKFNIHIKTGATSEPSGLHFFNGLIVGGQYDSLGRAYPAIGFEVMSYFLPPVAVGATPIVTPASYGVALTFGPVRKPNLRLYVGGAKDFTSNQYTYMFGVAAIVGWD